VQAGRHSASLEGHAEILTCLKSDFGDRPRPHTLFMFQAAF